MLDFSWSELLLVIFVAILVIGPKDIPKVMHTVGCFVRRMQYMKFAMSRQFEDIMQAHDIEEMRRLADQSQSPAPDAAPPIEEIDADADYFSPDTPREEEPKP